MKYKLRIGTTPTHVIELPYEAKLVKEVEIIYLQNGNIVLEKDLKSCNCEVYLLSLKLTQEETFLFDPGFPIKMEMRILSKDGDVQGIEPITLIPCNCCSRKVLK